MNKKTTPVASKPSTNKPTKPAVPPAKVGTLPVVEVKVSTVTSSDDIESVFKPNKLGYFYAHASSVVWTGTDIARYAFETVTEGQGIYASAMRRAILTISAAIACDESCAKEIKEALTGDGKWAEQTVAGIMSVAKMLPSFQAVGLDLNNVKDINGLRMVSKALKDTDKRKVNAVVAKLNKGESVRKVWEQYEKGKKGGDEPAAGGSSGAADPSFAKKTREDELYKMARAVAKDHEGDSFQLKKIVSTLAGCLKVNLTDSTIGATEE